MPAQAEHTLKVEQEIKLKQGHAEGLNRATTIQRSRLQEVVEKLRPKLALELEKRLARERREIVEALDAVGRAQERARTTVGLVAWCNNWPQRGFKPIASSYVFGLPRHENEPVAAEVVLNAMRASVYPRKPLQPTMPTPEPQAVQA